MCVWVEGGEACVCGERVRPCVWGERGEALCVCGERGVRPCVCGGREG